MIPKRLSPKAREALHHIRNAVMHTGKVPSVRQLMMNLEYQSPRSASLLLEELTLKGYLKKKSKGQGWQLIRDLEEGSGSRTVTIPLVGNAPCGAPILAEQNIEAMIPVSLSLVRPGAKYFLLRASGDSMNKDGIDDGDLMLVRQQSSAERGDRVVALINGEATVKKYYPGDNAIALKPHSTNPSHKLIILADDFRIQGVVVATLPNR